MTGSQFLFCYGSCRDKNQSSFKNSNSNLHRWEIFQSPTVLFLFLVMCGVFCVRETNWSWCSKARSNLACVAGVQRGRKGGGGVWVGMRSHRALLVFPSPSPVECLLRRLSPMFCYNRVFRCFNLRAGRAWDTFKPFKLRDRDCKVL